MIYIITILSHKKNYGNILSLKNILLSNTLLKIIPIYSYYLLPFIPLYFIGFFHDIINNNKHY